MARQTWSGRLARADRVHLANAGGFLGWFDDAWNAAEAVSPLLPQYRKQRKQRRVGTLEDDKTPAVKRYLADPKKSEVVGPLAVQLAAANALWVRTETLYVNLPQRGVGNQLDTPRGTRVFFGFTSAQVARNFLFGEVEIQVPGFSPIVRTVRLGSNMMDKINLPIPGKDGPANYDHAVLIFERAGTGPSGLPRFRLKITDDAGLPARKRSAANHVDLVMHGGRDYGLLF